MRRRPVLRTLNAAALFLVAASVAHPPTARGTLSTLAPEGAAALARAGLRAPRPASTGAATAALPTTGLVAAGEIRPRAQIDTPGRHSTWIGTESGTFEAWVWPLKIVRDLRVDFRFRDREIAGADIARRVEVRPEWSAITYAHEAFTVTQVIASPIDRPANLMLLRVDASVPITLRVAFHPDLHPMWPAGLGGQYSYWDESLPGFVLGEGSGRHAGLIAAPGATEPTINPAHSLPDQPTRFEIPVEAGDSGWIPLVVAGWTESMQGEGRGLAALRPLYEELVADPVGALQRNVEHYRGVLEGQARVSYGDEGLAEALAWAKVRLDQGLVCNPDLGCGLVAGYGGSGGGYRPGFAWYFGGDAFYNAWALTALGAHDTVRTALDLLARNQRDDGKIMHELSQGAGSLNWFQDYPYGYYHAETSAWFIDTVVRHARATGDLDWARRMWPHVLRALEYCVSADSDGDGLMDNTAAGLGAVEMGALREARVHQDVYLAAVWTRAATVLPQLARALGEEATAERVDAMGERARAALAERLDSPTAGWAFALGSDGSIVDEPSVWSILPAALGVGDPERAAHALRLVASPSITTDWGTRMLGSTSPLYDPLIYNQGTVWPFLTGFAAMAAYRHGLAPYGDSLLSGLARLTADHSRGAIHEVLSGDRYAPMAPSVPHQLFSTSSLVTPLIEGALGLHVDLLAGEIRVAPTLTRESGPLEIHDVPVGPGRLTLRMRHGRQVDVSSLAIEARLTGWQGEAPTLWLQPSLPAAARAITLDGADAAASVRGCATALSPVAAVWEREPGGAHVAMARVDWHGGLPWRLTRAESPQAVQSGERSAGPWILACRGVGDALEIDIAGVAGARYRLSVPSGDTMAPPTDVSIGPTASPVPGTESGPSWKIEQEREPGWGLYDLIAPAGHGVRAATLRLERSPGG